MNASNPTIQHALYPPDCVESLNEWIDALDRQWDAAHPHWTSDLFESLAREGKIQGAPSGVPQVSLPKHVEKETLPTR